jgi:hypothetical protein
MYSVFFKTAIIALDRVNGKRGASLASPASGLASSAIFWSWKVCSVLQCPTKTPAAYLFVITFVFLWLRRSIHVNIFVNGHRIRIHSGSLLRPTFLRSTHLLLFGVDGKQGPFACGGVVGVPETVKRQTSVKFAS